MPRQTDIYQRLREAREVADAGLGLRVLAERWQISRAGASQYLRRHAPDVRLRLRDNARSGLVLTTEAALRRLQNVAEFGLSGAARAENVSSSALHGWLARNYPDGVAAGLADLCDDEFDFEEAA